MDKTKHVNEYANTVLKKKNQSEIPYLLDRLGTSAN